MNIELAPDVQLRMKHPVSGFNEIALAPLRKEKESPSLTHFQIAIFPSVESLITLTSCDGHLSQLFSTLEIFSQLSVAAATSSSSWYHSQPLSPLNRSE